MEFVKLVTTVPVTHAEAVRSSMAAAGAGRTGNYSACSFSVIGVGRFKPEPGATPFLGTVGAMEEVAVERIEVTCERSAVRAIVAAARRAHPYEEVIIDLYPMLDLVDLD